MSDIASLLSQARTMATSYNAVMRQAEKGNTANQTIEQQKKQGLILNQNKIINDIDTQNFVIDSQGALMRAKNDFDDEYSPEQIKLLNKGIYYTNDDWETVKAGLGHFMYYDPKTKTTKEDYGIIASTIIGQLFLGENLKIFSESGKLEMGENGLKVTAIDGDDNTDLFVVQKQKVDDQGRPYVEKYIYVDSDGNVSITGNSVLIDDKPLIEYVDDAVDSIEVGWAVIVNVAYIDYVINTATLNATVYKNGQIQTTGFTVQWYKTVTSTSVIPETTTTVPISGATTTTLNVTDLNASYTCIVS